MSSQTVPAPVPAPEPEPAPRSTPAGSAAPAPGLGRRFLSRRRGLLILAAVLLGLLLLWRSRGPTGDAGTLETSLAEALATEGLRVDPHTVQWLSRDAGIIAGRPAVFVASPPGELPDLYYAEVRPGRDGAVIGVSSITNVTRTPGAAEEILARSGPDLLYASRVGDGYDAVVLVDLRGEPAALTADWPAFARFQNAVTNMQQTGRTDGLGRRRYALTSPPPRISARATEGGQFVITAGDARIVLDPSRELPVEGAARVEVRPSEKGRPHVVAWAVDTVRNVVGPAPIEWLEHHVFAVQDWAERTWFGAVGTEDTVAAVEDDMGVSVAEQQRRLRLTVQNPQIGWPPPALESPLPGAAEGEGQWIPVVDDPYVNTYPNAPPAFYQTFVRADHERPYTRVYVILFDPRQVQVHTMPGTREPESATGETGPGQIPRDPRTLDLLVAGFSGGFQALHGEFGMMHDRRVYLPPKPWAATLTIHDDGRIGMGSWPGPPPRRAWSERVANAQIPADVVALRQNLTSVVEDGRYNPWRRWYWGAAPATAGEQTYIDRTGLCLTREGFLAFFWGESMGPEELGRAMTATRCIRGLHLDMNTRHAGFAFFDTRRPDEEWAPLPEGRDDEWQHEGGIDEMPGWMYRSRKAVRAMALSPFPRYLPSDPRDFFYLTLKPVLPGPDVAGQALSTEGLPHAGWPHAFARARVGGAWVVRIDPARAVPGPLVHIAPTPAARPPAAAIDPAPGVAIDPTPGAPLPVTLGYLTGARGLGRSDAPHGVYVIPRVEHVGSQLAVGAPPDGAQVLLAAPALDPAASAALGVDRHGFLVYAEVAEGATASLAQVMREAGVDRAVALPDAVRLAFLVDGATIAPDGETERPVAADAALPLIAETRPAADVIFRDVAPMPYHRWGRLQDTRVRYQRDASVPARFGGTPGVVPDGGVPP